MSRLNTDNKDTMPVTDATYGRPPKKNPKAKPARAIRFGTGWPTLREAFAKVGL